MSDDRIGQPMSLSQLILLVGKNAADTQLARGDITQDQYDERIKILFPDLELVKKANGGLMSINNMTRPLGYKNGGETGFLTEPPPGMEFKPMSTMEYRDFNQNGKEDRSEGLYLPKDFQPKTDKGSKKNTFF